MLDDQQVDPHPQALRGRLQQERAVQHGAGGGCRNLKSERVLEI